MKRFAIDTNFNWLGPDFPAVSRRRVEELGLKAGDRVTVFQEDDEWTGAVKFDPTLPAQYQWYVALD